MGGNGNGGVNRIDADSVWNDIADGISDDDLYSLAPEGWRPTDKQMAYIRAYVSAPPMSTVGEMAATAGVDRTSVIRWRHGARFREWMSSVLAAACVTATDHVWRACHKKAMKGDAGCIRMWARRFDPVYANALADSEHHRPDAAAVPHGLADAAHEAIQAPPTTDADRHGQSDQSPPGAQDAKAPGGEEAESGV